MRHEISWKRLDVTGHDRCTLVSESGGYRIAGEARWEEGGETFTSTYEVWCNSDWATRAARVEGSFGARPLSFSLERVSGKGWYLDGARIDFADDLLDVDLGFTPATNTNAIRRMALAIGERRETTALWFDTEDRSFKRLMQVYERIGDNVYHYASPQHGYEAELGVSDTGLVLDYPDLWTALDEQVPLKPQNT